MLDRIFKLKKHGTTVSTEILAGVTVFITMAYILAVVPTVLSTTGMDKEAIFLATCFSTGLITIVMGLAVNFPIVLAPGLGLGAYFAVIAAKTGGIVSWQTALGIAFIAGIAFLLLTITRVRQILVEAIPDSLKRALVVGIGFFITIIGLKMSHLIVVNAHLGPSLETVLASHGVASLSFFEWDLSLGVFSKPDALLALIGLVITSSLLVLRIKGAILISIVVSTLVGIPLGITNVSDIHFSLPSLSSLDFGAMDIRGALDVNFIPIIFTFTFVGLMDTFSTLVSVADRAKILDTAKGTRFISRAMFVDAAGACFAAFLGLPSVTVYLESIIGTSAGGRTGLVAIVTGLLFISALVLSSLFTIIPAAATAPVLILIGVFMMSTVKTIDFEDLSEALPAFLTMVIMPFTYSIANGISAGVVFYVLLKIVMGKWRKIHWMMYVLAALIIAKFVFFN